MLHKSKINLSLILLLVGLGLIPTGLFVKSYLVDDVSSHVAPFLSNLEDEINSEIEANYLGLGVYKNLQEIYNAHITDIERDFALIYGMPSTLKYLKNVTLELLPSYINASRAASAIDDTISDVVNLNSTTWAFAMEEFFNNYTFQDDYFSTIEGVSEYMTGGTDTLNYSSLNYLIFGRNVNGTSYPGLRQNIPYGIGLLNWLEFYNNAEADIGTNRSLIQAVYNCTWSSGQLQNLSAYITTYLWDVIVKSDYEPMDFEAYSELVFYDQWANASWILSGFNLKYFTEYINTDVTGLEVGRNNPTYINYTSAVNLWDPLNSSSFVNDSGIWKWFDAYNGNISAQDELKAEFELNDNLMDRIYSWLFTTVRNNLVELIYPLPDPIGIGITILEYSNILYAEQWANGTYIEEGFDLGDGIDPFEIGIPIKSNISLTSAIALLNLSNPSSFIDRDGILKWIDAYEGDTTAQTELITEFNLDLDQLDLINNWLFNTMRYNIIPSITSDYTGITMPTFAQFEFYRQWSNGSPYLDGLDIGPFEGLTSISGWELGIPTEINIEIFTTYYLWNPNNRYSLVNWKGISLWFKAINNNGTFNFLLDYYNNPNVIRYLAETYDSVLSSDQMDAILAWIVDIRENFVLTNIQSQANLPTDNYTLGNNISFVFTITGGVISGIGALGIVLLLITKRK
jgi:hypothetical protein